MSTIYLAGGCFWGLQKFFDQFGGVIRTEVGYANGPDKAPSYQEVCRNSGHAETVLVEYDDNTPMGLTRHQAIRKSAGTAVMQRQFWWSTMIKRWIWKRCSTTTLW